MKRATKRMLIVSLFFAVMMISGCGNAGNIEQSTIIIKKDGAVSGVIVEDFDDSKYVSEELKAMLEEEISSYNGQAGEGRVTLEAYEVTEEKQVKIHLEYASFEDYAAFNDETLFAGTVSEAYEAGYEFVDMQNVNSEGAHLGKAEVLEKGSMKLVIFHEPIHIRVNGKITYVSDGVSQIEKKEAAVSLEEGTEGLFYLMYE